MTGESRPSLFARIARATAGAVLALIACLCWSPSAMASPKPDFSAVTSRAQAEALVREGKLVRILLFPAALGGEAIPENTSYAPPGAVDALKLAEATIERFARDGLIDKLDVIPDYRGSSVIPTRIAFHTKKDGKDARFDQTVAIW